MNCIENRLNGETGYFVSRYQIRPEFLKNSAAIFDLESRKKNQKVSDFSFVFSVSKICQRSRRQQLMEEFTMNFKAICLLWSESLKINGFG
jgi:hypothetical protein